MFLPLATTEANECEIFRSFVSVEQPVTMLRFQKNPKNLKSPKGPKGYAGFHNSSVKTSVHFPGLMNQIKKPFLFYKGKPTPLIP